MNVRYPVTDKSFNAGQDASATSRGSLLLKQSFVSVCVSP